MKLREALSRYQEQVMHRGPTEAESTVFKSALEIVKPIKDDDLASAIEVFRQAGYRNKGLAILLRPAVEAFMDSRWPDRNETD